MQPLYFRTTSLSQHCLIVVFNLYYCCVVLFDLYFRCVGVFNLYFVVYNEATRWRRRRRDREVSMRIVDVSSDGIHCIRHYRRWAGMRMESEELVAAPGVPFLLSSLSTAPGAAAGLRARSSGCQQHHTVPQWHCLRLWPLCVVRGSHCYWCSTVHVFKRCVCRR